MNNEQFQIQNLLFKFMRSFDEKNFEIMRNCLSEELSLDYSSFRKNYPTKQMSREYCDKRKESLQNLITQHNLSNIIIEEQENRESFKVYCNFIIYRFADSFPNDKKSFFHSYGQYEFKLRQNSNKFEIYSITQKVLMSEGDKSIHKGLQ